MMDIIYWLIYVFTLTLIMNVISSMGYDWHTWQKWLIVICAMVIVIVGYLKGMKDGTEVNKK